MSSPSTLEPRVYPKLDTPAFVIDLDIMERNLDSMAALCRQAGIDLRPHTKTHKSPLIARMQLDRGAVGIAVAKLGEAEVMADAGINGILVAYAIWGEPKLRRLAALCRRATISVAVDSFEVAEGVARVAREVGQRIPVYLEVDTGLHRMGLQPGAEVVALGQAVSRLAGLDVCGVMSHAGHIDVARSPEDAARISREDGESLVETAEALRRAGLDIRRVAPGSTPAARYLLQVPGVTELRPGTYVFNDVNAVARWSATWDDCAGTVLATVVSRPAPDRAVIDAGSKTFALDRSLHPDFPGYGYVMGHPELALARLSEEHGVLKTGDGGHPAAAGAAGHPPAPGAARPPAIGDRLRVVPNHVCPCLNHFDVAYGVRGDRVELEIPIAARGKLR